MGPSKVWEPRPRGSLAQCEGSTRNRPHGSSNPAGHKAFLLPRLCLISEKRPNPLSQGYSFYPWLPHCKFLPLELKFDSSILEPEET